MRGKFHQITLSRIGRLLEYLSEHTVRLIALEYPIVAKPDRLEALNACADDSFSVATLSGRIAAVAIYHQILQELLVHVIEMSRFHLRCASTEMELKFPAVDYDRWTFGRFITEADSLWSFDQKDRFISACRDFNSLRNRALHRLIAEEFQEEQQGDLVRAKALFDQAFAHYLETADWFYLSFKDMREEAIQYAQDVIQEETDQTITSAELLARCTAALR